MHLATPRTRAPTAIEVKSFAHLRTMRDTRRAIGRTRTRAAKARVSGVLPAFPALALAALVPLVWRCMRNHTSACWREGGSCRRKCGRCAARHNRMRRNRLCGNHQRSRKIVVVHDHIISGRAHVVHIHLLQLRHSKPEACFDQHEIEAMKVRPGHIPMLFRALIWLVLRGEGRR